MFATMKSISRTVAALGLFSALAVLLLAGCAGYQAGAGAKLPFESIYVAPVVNRSLAPQAQVLLTDQTTDRLIEGGRLHVTDKAAAQAQLTITLVDFRRSLAINQSTDTQLARAFDLELVATIRLVDVRTGKVYLDGRRVSAVQQVFGGSSEALAEYNAMPALTGKLALTIVNEVEGAW